MRLALFDQSPNTVAAVAGAVFVACVLLYPRKTTRWRLVFWLFWAACAGILCLTQSRGAGFALAALGALWGLRALGRPDFRLAAMVFMVGSLAIWTWAGLHGRAAATSLGHSAGMRADFAKAALMRAAEVKLHGMEPAPNFAEDAALRYGTPVSPEQRDIIRNPLSSLLHLAGEAGMMATLSWLAWLAPALCLAVTAVPAVRARVRPPGAFEEREAAGFWVIPSVCFYTAACACFNDLHQNTAGGWLIRASAVSGGGWLVFHLAHARWRPVAAGAGGAVALYVCVLAVGEGYLRRNQAEQGIRRWTIEERPLAGNVSLRVVEGSPSPTGTLVLFDHGGRGERPWAARQSAYRLVGQGWRLIEVRGGSKADQQVREACLPEAPLVALGVEGSVPAAFSRAMRPSAIVSIAPSRLVLVSDDGGDATTRRYWFFTDEAKAGEARRLLRRTLTRTETDTDVVTLGPDLADAMRSSLRRVAERHRHAADLKPFPVTSNSQP